jgi:hypothetical protein
MENMAATPTCTTATDPALLYEVIHNPFRYFTKYTTNSGGWCSSANQSTEGVLPYPGSSGLLTALGGANAPDLVWITPNDCHDMHGDTNSGSTCKTSTNSQLITAGDTWLNSNIGPVISSPWFSQNGIIIITWDESITSDTSGCCGGVATGGHIPTIVVTSNNKGLGNFTGTGDHYGTLAAIEKAYGVELLGGSANSINGDLTGAFGQATTNLLSPEDASFEGGTVGGWGPWTVNASATNSTAQALDGTHSLAFTTTSAGWYSNSSMVPITAGQTYTGIVHMRAATVGRPLIAWIRWNNSSGGFVGETDGLTGTSDVTTGWTQFTVTGTAPAGAVVGGVGIWDNSNASGVGEVHYLDVASLALAPATTNLLSAEDASFEGGTTGGWGPWTVNATAANSTAQALDGTHSLKFTTTAAGWYSNSSMVPVTAGQTYTGIVSMRAATVGRPLIAWIRWNNSSGAFVGETDGLTGTSDITTGWTQFTVTGTAPAGAVGGGVGIWDSSNASGVGEVRYLDEAQIALGTTTVWTP